MFCKKKRKKPPSVKQEISNAQKATQKGESLTKHSCIFFFLRQNAASMSYCGQASQHRNSLQIYVFVGKPHKRDYAKPQAVDVRIYTAQRVPSENHFTPFSPPRKAWHKKGKRSFLKAHIKKKKSCIFLMMGEASMACSDSSLACFSLKPSALF